MTDPIPLDEMEMIELAAKGVGKIDKYGPRGLFKVTNEELEAMALTLVCLGLRPTYPSDASDSPIAGEKT